MYLKEFLSTIEYEGIFIIIKPFSKQGKHLRKFLVVF